MQWTFFDFIEYKSSYFLNSLLQESKTLKPSLQVRDIITYDPRKNQGGLLRNSLK